MEEDKVIWFSSREVSNKHILLLFPSKHSFLANLFSAYACTHGNTHTQQWPQHVLVVACQEIRFIMIQRQYIKITKSSS